jgi:4,5-dihydroxyphthalate decarboxylase
MGPLVVSLACGDYDRVRPILDGRVGVEGADVVPVTVMPASELFWRMLRHEEFDVGELSLSNHIMAVSRGDDRFVGIPVFPHRSFRHSALWVRADSPLERLEDLAGRRVGIPEYSMTMLLFVRGLLAHEHGVRPTDVTWVRARPERVEYDIPSVRIEDAPAGETLDRLLLDGRIDALVSTRVPTAGLARGAVFRRLVSDPKGEEEAYFRRTGIFPIMHLIVIRRAVYTAHRWLAVNLVTAFERSKALAYERLLESQPSCSLPWLGLDLEREWGVFGGDPFPYGVGPNLATLTAATSWSYEQGLSARPVAVEELFAPETVDSFTHHAQR